MEKRILVVTNQADLHANVVIERLKAKGAQPFRVNLDEFPAQFRVTLALTDGRRKGVIEDMSREDVLDISSVGAIWLRKPAPFNFPSKDMAVQETAFARAEMKQIFLGMLYSRKCHWVSHPAAIRAAIWKAEQLMRAASLGFEVPSSIVTNSLSFAQAFRTSADSGMIFKALSSPLLAADKVGSKQRIASGLATTLITDDDEDALDSIRELPCFFQHHIPKQFDLRVTVIGRRVFAARIHSQADERTRIDFRDYTAEVPYEAADLPREVERRCVEFVHSYQLHFGVLDLILTPQGKYVFLENNPVGQFLFVEELVPSLTITDALAEDLVTGAAAWS
ncbi:MAG: MvdC/MvdD family ATP grasp protein [Chloroflexota bacterium]